MNRATREYLAEVNSCKCDYLRNFWFSIITRLSKGAVFASYEECSEMEVPDLDTSSCRVGYVALALMCSFTYVKDGKAAQASTSLKLFTNLLPEVRDYLKGWADSISYNSITYMYRLYMYVWFNLISYA